MGKLYSSTYYKSLQLIVFTAAPEVPNPVSVGYNNPQTGSVGYNNPQTMSGYNNPQTMTASPPSASSIKANVSISPETQNDIFY